MDNFESNNNVEQTPVNNNKKALIYAGAAAGALVVLILLIVLLSSVFGGSYKKPIKKSIALINKKVENDLEYSKWCQSALDQELMEVRADIIKSYKEDAEETYEDAIDELKDQFGNNFKIKYKIKDADKMDKDDLEEMQDDLEEYIEYLEDSEDTVMDRIDDLCDEEDISSSKQKKLEKAYENYFKKIGKSKITAAYEVELECTIKGSEDEEDFDLEVIIVKLNGDWILYGGGITPREILYSLD